MFGREPVVVVGGGRPDGRHRNPDSGAVERARAHLLRSVIPAMLDKGYWGHDNTVAGGHEAFMEMLVDHLGGAEVVHLAREFAACPGIYADECVGGWEVMRECRDSACGLYCQCEPLPCEGCRTRHEPGCACIECPDGD